jgi:DNA mismatch repair protein MutL
MAKVRILPDRVANQIAAGEVIERPAAAVKELVENALDAGATKIVVEFAHAGRSLLRVEDDGAGMSPEDARMALQRHATSKIAETGDLDRLSTFGFRGEALPSIASVSRFTLRTRERGADVGTEIVVDAGRVIREGACGMPQGTRIDVEHLFEPVPARRKFLKTDRTEAAHIVSCVRLYALACPRVSFALYEEGREVFHSPRCDDLTDRVAEIYGAQAAEGLVPIQAAEAGFTLTGVVSRPGAWRATRHDLQSFINARPVDSRTLYGALMEAYRELLPEGRYPAAFLFLGCDPAAVDVNVHPAKREVRFRSDAQVRAFILRSVLGRLRELAAPAPAAAPVAPVPLVPLSVAPAFVPVAREAAPPMPEAVPAAPQGPAWRYLGTALGDYVVFETAQGVVLLDRRAAHERVWYERLRTQFEKAAVPVQSLLLPLNLELTPVLSALLLDHRDFLVAHGIEVAEFGRDFFRVDALPAWLEPGDAEAFIRDVLEALREGRITPSNAGLARDELARLASAKAVRLPALAGPQEASGLLRELFATPLPGSSPSGRPTYVELSHSELARRFQK